MVLYSTPMNPCVFSCCHCCCCCCCWWWSWCRSWKGKQSHTSSQKCWSTKIYKWKHSHFFKPGFIHKLPAWSTLEYNKVIKVYSHTNSMREKYLVEEWNYIIRSDACPYSMLHMMLVQVMMLRIARCFSCPCKPTRLLLLRRGSLAFGSATCGCEVRVVLKL